MIETSGPSALEKAPPGAPRRTGLVARIGIELGTLALDADLAVEPGRTLAVLGPNGAGKSTLLRALAGLVPLQRGRIELDGAVLDDPQAHRFVPPERRGAGYVFQDYLLFPHLSAIDNVAFGPRVRHRVRRAAARAAAREMLDRLGLAEVAHLRPGALSGGQAQRVALARALAPGPGILLLDEPLAALDAGTRLEVRAEIRALLPTLDVPVVMVTHDPVDALTLADDVAVLERGRVVQRGEPAEVITRPRTPYVARLAGLNLFPGTAAGGVVTLDATADRPVTLPAPPGTVDGSVLVALRPSEIGVHRSEPGAAPGTQVLTGPVTSVETLGDQVRVQVASTPAARAEIPARRLAELRLVRGTPVWLTVDEGRWDVYSQGGAAP
ncbi:ABC transporter ATP-binding protein [Parafrankia colletiae]|uniref:ABC transporter ATP-binding protein n=1 Tax=Parafrankia colletiae TaxID=573497 RepID=A0A1S1RJ50_9ACTN|nr:ABC transporter ATP-binding protein [Parafrankia colletiae]MCK9902470.1 ABC transporter ATP-binding protein [Frankia sp. Cpl3]OHV46156.1 ABC transporter ATP-binding protein [Parafrankia colletiae]